MIVDVRQTGVRPNLTNIKLCSGIWGVCQIARCWIVTESLTCNAYATGGITMFS